MIEEEKKAVAELQHYANLTDEQKCKDIQSGAYNTIIKGYIILALQNGGLSGLEIEDVLDYNRNLFGDYSADYALKVGRGE